MNLPPTPGQDGPLQGRARHQPQADIGPADVGQPGLGERPCAVDEFDTRMLALLKLRKQMLELHARLEYLRLMLRLSVRFGAGP